MPRVSTRVAKHPEIGTRFKAARDRLDMTQGEFAVASGINLRTLQALEQGVYVPSYETLLKLFEMEKRPRPKRLRGK